MLKPLRLTLVVTALAMTAQAHFTFVVPDGGGRSARFFVSEKLEPDDAVDVAIGKTAKLKIREAAGAPADDLTLEMTLANDCLRLNLPGSGPRTVYGIADLGVSANRGPKPFLLLYYPKTVVGDFEKVAPIGGDQVAELIPLRERSDVSLLFIARGKPLAGAEITVILPSGSETKVKTNDKGVAGPFPQRGRFGAWARYFEDGRGERDGKAYEQVRHYATLVFDAHAKPEALKPLMEGTSSFGAAADSRWLYVYGGHVSPTHTYSTASVSGKFGRWNLESQTWEELPSGSGLQGLNLALHNGAVYRVGGMAPRNKPGDKQDTHSVTDVVRFDPQKKNWSPVAPLPEARSSHDVAVIDGKLIVTGGWNMRGEQPTEWAKSTLTLDLNDPRAQWKSLPQPFERRALITAVHGEKMYVIGGIMPSGSVSSDVDIFDPRTSVWKKGPALPGPSMNGFAPAAADHNGRLYVSAGDGGLYRLNEAGTAWQDAGVTTPRLAHRMVSTSQGLLILGGAIKGRNLDLVELVPESAPLSAAR
jgi:hypothetical protein